MSHDPARREILLREYQEAGEVLRAHSSLIRTGITIMTAINAGILGFIGKRAASSEVPLNLSRALGQRGCLV